MADGVALNADGTAEITLPGKVVRDPGTGDVTSEGTAVTVYLPQASAGDLLTFWLEFDKLQEAAKAGEVTSATEVLGSYAEWIRRMLFELGAPRVYRVEDESAVPVKYQLIRDDVIEPAWFMSPQLIRDLLAHWQASPLDRSSDPRMNGQGTTVPVG